MGTLAFGLRADDPPVFSDALEVRATLYYYHYYHYHYYCGQWTDAIDLQVRTLHYYHYHYHYHY